MEEARSKAAKEAQYIRLQDLRSAYMAEKDSLHKEEIAKEYEKEAEIYNNWNLYNGRQKVEWERFTKYLKEQHLSEMTAMFRGMDAKQIESLNFQEGKYADWVKRMVTNYAKSHKISYDEAFNYLKNWVASANQWSIFIPLTISTDKNKTVMKTLEEADAAADKAWKDMQRLDKEIARLRKKGAKEVDENNITASEDDQRLTKALKERAAAEKDYNKAVSDGGESKKENAANTKAQKQAESELQKALKEELQLIDKVRSQYKKLTDAGVSRAVAMKTVTEQFGDSIKHINAVLGKNGLPKFDIKSFAGTDNPHEMMVMLKKQIDSAKKVKNIKPEEIKDLEIKYSEIKVDAEAYDATKIKKGLDNELGRLKDEYELAVELDANPELGNMFADMFDIDLDTLPRTAKEYADRYTKSLNKYFKQMGANIELPNMLNLTRNDMEAFTEQLGTGELQQAYFDLIQKGYEATQAARKKEATDAIKEYDKLLQKYSEYQYKLTQIAKEANEERKALVIRFGNDEQQSKARTIMANLEVEKDPQKANELKNQLMALVDKVVGDDEVKIHLKVAIDKKEAQESAKAAFEEFQKSPEWIVATGDLSGMTNKALGTLINNIEEYKKKAKNLDPKQIKQINKALSSLYKQQRQGNPFAAIANAFAEAEERASEFTPKIQEAEKELRELENNRDQSKLAETAARIEELKKNIEQWKKEQKELGDVSVTTLVSGINSAIGVAKEATGIFTDMMSALGDKESVESINKVFSILDKAGQGAAIGAQIGGGYGAAIGGILGGLSGIVTTFADEWSGNRSITKAVERSTLAVKQLESSYIDLEQAVDRAYGSAVIGAKQAALANKELQLQQIQSQIELEKSRKSKNRDADTIAELQKQYKELYYEIQNGYSDLVDELMGTDVGSFAENLVSSMIDAFKQGEDYMDVFSKKFDDMIDNMIMKSIVSRVVSQYLDAVWEDLNARINERTKKEREDSANAQHVNAWAKQLSDEELFYSADYYQYLKSLGDIPKGHKVEDVAEFRKYLEEEEKAAQKHLEAASVFADSDVSYVMDEISRVMPELGEKLQNILGEYYKFGESSETQLSALQQGISQISEPTANALEAYANSISQQAYLRNDLLVQIRDTIMSFDMDVQLGVFSQMLLQLQNNYIVMQSMQSMMEGWTTPSGQGIRVELIS
jgi:hypothetical protein